MDNAYIALALLTLRSNGFRKFCCDDKLSLGVNLISLAKVLKCANNDDAITIKAQDDAKTMEITIESQTQEYVWNDIAISFFLLSILFHFVPFFSHQISEYELKLENLKYDHIGVPETEYACIIRLQSVKFARICRDLSQFGKSMVVTCTKEGEHAKPCIL